MSVFAQYDSDTEDAFPTAQACSQLYSRKYALALQKMKQIVRRQLCDEIYKKYDIYFSVTVQVSNSRFDLSEDISDYVEAFLKNKGYSVQLTKIGRDTLEFELEIPKSD